MGEYRKGDRPVRQSLGMLSLKEAGQSMTCKGIAIYFPCDIRGLRCKCPLWPLGRMTEERSCRRQFQEHF